MARIRPFCGVRYNPAVVGDLRSVISPPYDVISPDQQTLLHLRHPYNAVHLDLSQNAERYTYAAETLREWLERGVLVRDREPALYVTVQEFSLRDGRRQRRTGMFVALRLEEFSSGIVRPHERTFEDAKKDRLALLRACHMHLSPIFCLYATTAWSLEEVMEPQLKADPLIDIVDEQDVSHKVWRVTDHRLIADITDRLAPESLVIADGHHRYETALRYRREVAAQEPGNDDAPFHYVLAYLANAEDAGVVILPTHRLLRGVSLPPLQALRTALHRDFRLALFPLHDAPAFLRALHAPTPGRRIGCVLAGAGHYWVLSFDDRVTRTLAVPAPLRDVDVTVLHELILSRLFGLSQEAQAQHLDYTTDEEEAIRLVTTQQCQAAFVLNPTTFAQVRRVCEAGEVMPPKSTYFFPKLPTGLVFLPARE
ncbi:MAG: DUF1015 domain-containing protein [Candidatus Binatia bacterium]|nr:DUF1015 domain-containing protein [Candidatus Binatia bacterium]